MEISLIQKSIQLLDSSIDFEPPQIASPTNLHYSLLHNHDIFAYFCYNCNVNKNPPQNTEPWFKVFSNFKAILKLFYKRFLIPSDMNKKFFCG